MTNPFPKDSLMYYDYEILKDGQWHCSKCELKSGQAKTYQTMRKKYDIRFTEATQGRWSKKIHCKNCGRETEHRQIIINP